MFALDFVSFGEESSVKEQPQDPGKRLIFFGVPARRRIAYFLLREITSR